MKKELYKDKGISLIALIVTIVILLILAVVSIKLVINNGILEKAESATNNYKIAQIKEKIELAVNAAKLKGVGILDKTNLGEELENEFGENNYEVAVVGKGYLIILENVQYLLNEDGTVGDGIYVEETEIENAGDLSKGGQYDGTTEETAYRIACIEDLVEWTNNYSKYSSKYIVLEKTIDFEYVSDYNDYNTKTTDINGNGEIEALITELTTGTGFKPISSFSGTFDGKGNEIRNLYENRTGNAGLYIELGSANIKNLGIKGSITATGCVGEIASTVAKGANVDNCYSNGNIKNSDGVAGGIIGQGGAHAELYINNCYNNASINAETSGGIIGTAYPVYITNCYNKGNIVAFNKAGGIIGGQNYETTIYNSYNTGYVKSNKYAGGIIGYIYSSAKIINNYNIGKIEGAEGYTGSVVGQALWNNPNTEIINTFYLEGTAAKATNTVTDTAISCSEEEIISEELVNKLNNYIDTNTEECEGWKRWKYNEGSYPIFE